MDAIKKFFEKKKADAKFKVAGEGHKLKGQYKSPAPDVCHGYDIPQQRATPSSGSQRAGAAALARAEASKKTDVNWSLQAIKAQAKRELEAEQKALQQMQISESQQDTAVSAPYHDLDIKSPPMLAVSGVYFYCQLIGPGADTYDKIKSKIRDFLYSQVDEDKGISSCLIIHTCNKNKEKIVVCVETLCKYIENIVSNPEEEKYRKIRISNRAYQERVFPIEGTKEFLEAAGFIQLELPFNDTTELFWVLPEEKLSDLVALEQLRDALVSAEPIRPQLHRNAKVLLPAEASKHTDLPAEFFSLTAEELKKEMKMRADAAERSMMLRTKAMREKDEMREMKKYRFSLIRVRFPDGLILQGTFGVHEKFAAVCEFVRGNLANDWRPFVLRLGGSGKMSEEDEEQSLTELRLAPAVVFMFEWDQSIQDPSLDDNIYLKQETLQLLQSYDV